MTELAHWLHRLEACVQREIAAQARVLERLDAEEIAISRGSPEEVLAAAEALGEEVASEDARSRERRAILTGLAASFEVSPDSLTLSSIVERIGEPRGNLAHLRTELRALVAQVVRRTRRIGSLARLQGQVLHEAIGTVISQELQQGARSGGALVNAEA